MRINASGEKPPRRILMEFWFDESPVGGETLSSGDGSRCLKMMDKVNVEGVTYVQGLLQVIAIFDRQVQMEKKKHN